MNYTLMVATLAAGLSIAPVMAQHDTPVANANYPSMDTGNVRPDIDFAGVQADLAGEPTRILVLGTSHLNNLPEAAFQPSHLALVLERLETFDPDIIAIESIGGRTCDELRRFAELYPGVADQYCRDPAHALATLGLTQAEAAAQVETLLDEWPEEPSPEARRHFAALLFGAGEPWSAALQWSYLEPDERIADENVGEELLTFLDRAQTARNENRLIGIELARTLGLQTLATMDDHSADIIHSRMPDNAGLAVQAVWQTNVEGEAETQAEAASYLGSAESVLAGYRFINSERYQRQTIASDFGLAASATAYDAAARQYLGWWQVRGLRMAANVVEAAANQPGARVLVIVGASHKAYFDSYLDMMHDIELVDVDEVLHD